MQSSAGQHTRLCLKTDYPLEYEISLAQLDDSNR